ncbi:MULTISPECIES: acyl-CoA dehydrogenase family protein [unclassified Streptomyces]|uniref:acyl-CoA dehydrogenase family protein n=1 Tax=unclassified Streptomyces TaxID=2593676 RepID=UPI000DC79092|nr:MULTISPECIES: acyl-CoA dehydrogenase family protein [unclassified Streptomyces]AWZ04296.1 acyl-CoA dehydrogenase [Streptomyces sp. ICC4]AWZ12406.1 acyl-CoA dehydrogenase [Streptomyces sp. ICC1]
MRFLPTEEQSDFARSLHGLLGASDVPAAVRAWGAGDHAPGRALWTRLAGTSLFALAVDEAYDGVGPLPLELSLGFVELGRAGVPGPAVETAAAAVLLSRLGDEALAKRFLPGLAAGETSATLTLPGAGPYALDADAATHLFTVSPAGELRLAGPGPLLASTDPARRLCLPEGGGELLAAGPHVTAAAAAAGDWARLLTAAQCLGTGEALLARTVEYAKQRTQFGTAIGGFQAVKHRLADTLLGLEFARPLLWAAALSLAPEEVAAAKLTAGEAAYAAAMTALQLHGAVGYTEELDLSLWLRKARPLRDAWGTPAQCRAAVLQGLAR